MYFTSESDSSLASSYVGACHSLPVIIGYHPLQVIQFDVRSDQLRKQISRELHTLHGSRHPHIVAYYQSFLQDGAITIAMEYMNRDTLAHLLKRQAALQERHLACIARQVKPSE